jgi:hypothetical protein
VRQRVQNCFKRLSMYRVQTGGGAGDCGRLVVLLTGLAPHTAADSSVTSGAAVLTFIAVPGLSVDSRSINDLTLR